MTLPVLAQQTLPFLGETGCSLNLFLESARGFAVCQCEFTYIMYEFWSFHIDLAKTNMV